MDFEASPDYKEPIVAPVPKENQEEVVPVPMVEEEELDIDPVPMVEEEEYTVPMKEPKLDIRQMLPKQTGFIAFAGTGNRLDGKMERTNSETEIQERQSKEYIRGTRDPDYNYEAGNIRFIRDRK